MSSTALFNTSQGTITKQDVIDTLKKFGLKKGDVVLVHSKISSFGKLATFDQKTILGSLIDAFTEIIGEDGLLIMPTFTYNLDQLGTYDAQSTPSKVGVLTEYFRTLPEVVRTDHPNHSFALWGKRKSEFVHESADAFDEQSLFSKLEGLNCKQVFFGVPIRFSCTYIHYLERLHGIPYRYLRTFPVMIKQGKKEVQKAYPYYWKYFFFLSDVLPYQAHLIEHGHVTQKQLGDTMITYGETSTLKTEGLKLIDQDPYHFAYNQGLRKHFNTLILPFLKFFPWPLRWIDSLRLCAVHFILRRPNLKKKIKSFLNH